MILLYIYLGGIALILAAFLSGWARGNVEFEINGLGMPKWAGVLVALLLWPVLLLFLTWEDE